METDCPLRTDRSFIKSSSMGKRNLMVAQGGGPTAAINSSLCGIVEQALREEAVDEVYGARYGLEGVLHADLIDLQAEAPSTLEALKNAPGSALGSSRARLSEEDYGRVLETFEQYNVQYFLYIGGNGSMAACHHLHRSGAEENAGVQVIGVPKTIDNDIPHTDHSPGYGSASRYYAVSVIELGRDVESLPTPVSVFETMGRDTGWLAAATSLAQRSEAEAPHLIYVPERPLARNRFLNDVQRVYEELGWVVAVVSEGVIDEDGMPLSVSQARANVDDFGRELPGGAAAALADLVNEELGLRARSEKPGLCGRASVAHASEVDRREAYELGRAGVRRIVRGERGTMIALRREEETEYACTLASVELSDVAEAERPLPARFISEEGNAVTQAFRDYAAPLLGGPLPRYARLANHPVKKASDKESVL